MDPDEEVDALADDAATNKGTGAAQSKVEDSALVIEEEFGNISLEEEIRKLKEQDEQLCTVQQDKPSSSKKKRKQRKRKGKGSAENHEPESPTGPSSPAAQPAQDMVDDL